MLPENQQAIENEIGDDELQQWLTSVGDGAEIELPSLSLGGPFQPPEPPVAGEGETGEEDDDEIPDDGEDGDEHPEGTPAPQAGADNDFFEIAGNKFARADIERLYNFDQYLRANPDKAALVTQAITGQQATPAAPAVPTPATPTDSVEEWKAPDPPDFLDLEDPAQKFQWDTHVQTQKVLHDQEQRSRQFFAQQAAIQQQAQTRQAETDMAQALTVFKAKHPNLNDDDITAIRNAAGPFVPSMLAQLPPVEALTRSMEVGGMMDEELRAKLTDPEVRTRTTAQQTKHRKRISGQISGSPRSAPKTEPTRPAYQSDKDFLNDLAQGFNEAMQR